MNLRSTSALLLLAAPLAIGEDELSSEQINFFEAKIRPAFAEHCYKCHSADEKIKGGLQLDTRAGLRHGGDSGEVIVPGKPDESLLWTAINWADEDYEMPPKRKLPASVIADFKKWIEMGAPDPRGAEKLVVKTEIDIEEGRKFWSFQKPVQVAPPEVMDPEWSKSDVDRFILARLDENELSPARDAGPDVQIGRAHV